MQTHYEKKSQHKSRSSKALAAAQNYEAAFAKSIAPDARAFSFWKGRIALYAILRALGIGEGDEVILPAFTCIVVPNAIRFTGAAPVYVDIAPDGYNIDPKRVKDAITPRTRAVIIQHTFGIPGPLYECLDLARRVHVDVIEDCAHAFGSRFDCQPLGSFGKAAFFSSQWSKPYTTGLGGMAVTRDADLARRLQKVLAGCVLPPIPAQMRLLLQYGIYQHYYSPQIYWQAQDLLRSFGRLGLFVGSSSDAELSGEEMPIDHTWCMAPSQKKAGMQEIGNFDQMLAHHRELAEFYDNEVFMAGWEPVQRAPGISLLRYPLLVPNKTELLDKARSARIELGCWFETPLHPIPLEAHAKFNFVLGEYPHAERTAAQIVNLPMNQWITLDEARRVVRFVRENSTPVAQTPIELYQHFASSINLV